MSFRTLDLNLLRVFDVVMVERNVTRAAERLAMTQPAVSNALRRLREATGEEWFAPRPSGVTPTSRALALWPEVHQAMETLRRSFGRGAFDARRDTRTFSLAMADATAAVLTPPLVHLLQHEEAAQVHVRVLPLTSRDPRPLLEQGGADAAVGFFPEVAAALAAQGASSAATLELLYDCDYVCVMRRGHALEAEPALTLDAYCAARHLRVSFAGRERGFVDEALARLGRERRVVMTVQHFSIAGRVVRESDLLTVLPRSYLPATGVESDLAVRSFPCPLPRVEVGLLWHRRHDWDPAHAWLAAHTRARRRTALDGLSKRTATALPTHPRVVGGCGRRAAGGTARPVGP